jgi:UDP-glucose 4-epimerase
MEIPSKLEKKSQTLLKYHINAILLRYFNPIGAHPSAEIGITYWSTSKLSTPLLRRLGLITKSSLFTMMQRLTEQR